MKKTKIVSTLGPASNDIETITALAKAVIVSISFEAGPKVLTILVFFIIKKILSKNQLN